VKSIDNSANREAQGGAGTGSAEIVSELGAVAVLTGHLGPKAFAALEIAGIPGYAAVGRSVSEAVKAYVAKELETLTAGPAGIKP
jgi:predicted Fe-Mo cluster-binding NifX family protein